MEYSRFKIEMENYLKELNIDLREDQINMFYTYMNMLIEKNKVMNLTAITKPEEIILKHFIDSLAISNYIENNKKIIDIGTGAGFPGIPLKLQNDSLEICLLDSLNKRINFLNEVIENIELKKINAVHGRAEDFGQNKLYREQYDATVSRAVAPLNILLEYMLPFLKVNGQAICMKGNITEEEIKNSENALSVLGGRIEKIEKFMLPKTDINRTVVLVKKTKNTPKQFPRNSGIPSKKPL